MYHRKCFKNKYKTNKSKKERIGIPTGLYDKNKIQIFTGDKIKMYARWCVYEGIVLWNRDDNSFGLFMGCWYLDKNIYNPDCYGKYIRIKKDNGMRMDIEIVKQE